MSRINQVLLAGLLSSALLPNVYAEEAAAPAAPASPHTLTANIGLYGQYVFRGITYTRERPALQGGFDYSHSSGIYLGVWGSNVDKDALAGNTMEIDLYGGYLHSFNDDWSMNVGFLEFYYPDTNKTAVGNQNVNTLELNAAVTYKWLTLKESVSVTDFFGINSASGASGDSQGTNYTELNFNYKLPVQDINLALHVGYQNVRNLNDASYTDFLIGFNKDFSVASSTGWNAGVNFTTTDANDSVYVDAKGRTTGDDQVILFLKRTF